MRKYDEHVCTLQTSPNYVDNVNYVESFIDYKRKNHYVRKCIY